MTRLAHLSDVHFGRIRGGVIVDALVDDIGQARPDAIVISGDLTQRAYSWQYRAARALVDRLRQEVIDALVVVPGNHDVWPWWFPSRRLSDPVGRYREMITADLAPLVKLEDTWILGLNSAHGRTVKGGMVTAGQIEMVRTRFEGGPVNRVLVVHHPLERVRHASSADLCRGGGELLEAAAAAGVSVVLSGHLHVVQSVRSAAGPMLVHAGTATSTRGRGPDRDANSYNIVDLDGRHVTVERRDFHGGRFGSVHKETMGLSVRPVVAGL